MKTVNIKGKEYVEVNERIKYFRANFPDHKLVSDMISNENGVCIIKAAIINEKNEVIATGMAYEKEGSTFINKTSYIENCETSAWGRALGNLGIGIDTSIASSNEVNNAIKQQEKDFITDGQKMNIESLLDTSILDDNQKEALINEYENYSYSKAEKAIIKLQNNQKETLKDGFERVMNSND